MGIKFDEADRLFFIETAHSSMCLAIVDEEGFIVDTIPLSPDSAVPYDIIDFYLESGYDVFID